MAMGFPLYTDLTGNNCTVFGGGENTTRRVRELLRFGAKVTVISPTLCPALEQLSEAGEIRHIPRKYYRGDCSNAQMCIAATDDTATNIAIATECKAKSIPINVTEPSGFGNFSFPRAIITDHVTVAVDGDLDTKKLALLRDKLEELLPELLKELDK